MSDSSRRPSRSTSTAHSRTCHSWPTATDDQDEVSVGIGFDHVLFSSARHGWLKDLRHRRPDFEVQAILGLFPEDPIDFNDDSFDTYNPRITRISFDDIMLALARGIKPTDAARTSPMLEGKPAEYDGFIMHLDEVISLPEGTPLLATNDHTHVQTVVVDSRST